MQRTLRATHASRQLCRIQRPFSTSPNHHGLLTNSSSEPLDPSKQGSSTTQQAKNPEGATPAEQQAKIVKQQGPGQTQEEGRATQKGGGGEGDGNTQQSGLGQKKPGEKSGEDAVNPAISKS